MMNIKYNNKYPSEEGWYLATRPQIEPSELQSGRYTIPGRSELVGTEQTRTNAKVRFMLHKPDTDGMPTWGNVLKWLREAGHDLVLYYGDTNDGYKFEVLETKITAMNDVDDNYSRLEVEMEVYPFKYASVGDTAYIPSNTTQTVVLRRSETSEPLYRVIGTGYFEVNGNRFTINEGAENACIDVRRSISYEYQGTTSNEPYVSGDYKGLVLKPGNNIITTNGLNLYIEDMRNGYVI